MNGQQLEVPCVYLMRNRKDPEIHTEPTIEILCGVEAVVPRWSGNKTIEAVRLNVLPVGASVGNH